MKRRRLSYVLAIAFMLQAYHAAHGQQQSDDKSLAPVSHTYIITGATIIQAPGRKIEQGSILIKDGLIKALGKNLEIPGEAIEISGDSLFVYAGFIDGLSHAGVAKPKEENKERLKDTVNPPPDRVGITPQNDVRNMYNSSEKSVEELRSIGFTTAHIVPYGGMMPGMGAIVLLGNDATDHSVVSSKASFYSELAGAERGYPNTVIGVIAKWRELYHQASLAKNYEALYASNRTGLERPATNRVLETLYPVIDKRMPVAFKGASLLEVQRILAMQNEHGFTLLLGDLREGWDVIHKIKASNTRPFLSLDLPDEVKKADKKSEQSTSESSSTLDKEKEALEKRKQEFIGKYTSQAAAFQRAGLPFGFSTMGAKTNDIPKNIRRIVASGLTEDQALAALTTTPAQLLGLSDRMGTIDIGKMANLVITHKSYFHEKSKVTAVFVDGMYYKPASKEESKTAKAETTSQLTGKWNYTVEMPQGTDKGIIHLKNQNDAWSGTITIGGSAKEHELKSIVQEGNKLSFTYSIEAAGATITIEVKITVTGNTFQGTMKSPQLGSLPIKGVKETGR